MSSKDESDKRKIEAAFYAAVESQFTEEELEHLSLEDEDVVISFVDGSEQHLAGVDTTKLVANLASMGFASMIDEAGRRLTIFAHNIISITADGKQS